MDTLRRVGFEEGKPGLQLTFLNRDLRKLYNDLGPTYIEILNKGLMAFDIDVIEQCLKVSAKDADSKPMTVSLDDFDEIPFDQIQMKCLDALSMAINGRLWKEHQVWVEEQILKYAEDRKKKENPTGPVVSLETSGAPPSAPA